jgi:hypothetical protein
MYCGKCGTELPEEASFCLKCGKSQKPDVVSVELKYETCEITWTASGVIFRKSYFWAKAIGSKGIYDAGKSNIFLTSSGVGPDIGYKDVVAAHTALVNNLVGDGWGPTGDRGNAWYSLRFQRLVKE